MSQMISIDEAMAQVLAEVRPFGTERAPLREARGRILAEDLLAPIDTPPFDASAMDGYAVRAADLGLPELRMIGEVAAGAGTLPVVGPGEAARIFTGAPVPPGADTVVIQEDTSREGDRLRITEAPAPGANIRAQGEAMAKGALAMAKGERLHAASVGLLASLGADSLLLGRRPVVSVISTGSELIRPPAPLGPGQIYESNSTMIAAALRELGIAAELPGSVLDQEAPLAEAIRSALARSEVLILSGGVSVGDYDLVREVLPSLGVREIFWKVRQKPGKPIYFGVLDDPKGSDPAARKLVFGLPGNPASALSCFYLYVRAALLKGMGASAPALPTMRLPLAERVTNRGDRAHLIRVKIEETEEGPILRLLRGQGSHVLASFASADALAHIGEEQASVEAGERVLAYRLPR